MRDKYFTGYISRYGNKVIFNNLRLVMILFPCFTAKMVHFSGQKSGLGRRDNADSPLVVYSPHGSFIQHE